MVFALTERNEWRTEMKNGEIPEDVRRSIELYKKMRSESTWRSSRFVECLGEAALLWFESQNKEG